MPTNLIQRRVDIRATFATAYGRAPFEGARKQRVPMVSLDDAWE